MQNITSRMQRLEDSLTTKLEKIELDMQHKLKLHEQTIKYELEMNRMQTKLQYLEDKLKHGTCTCHHRTHDNHDIKRSNDMSTQCKISEQEQTQKVTSSMPQQRSGFFQHIQPIRMNTNAIPPPVLLPPLHAVHAPLIANHAHHLQQTPTVQQHRTLLPPHIPFIQQPLYLRPVYEQPNLSSISQLQSQSEPVIPQKHETNNINREPSNQKSRINQPSTDRRQTSPNTVLTSEQDSNESCNHNTQRTEDSTECEQNDTRSNRQNQNSFLEFGRATNHNRIRKSL